MTRKNLTWNLNENQKTSPFMLAPVGKDYLWGGTRLITEWGKDIALEPLAETWECSTHKDGESIVKSGVHAGMTLTRVLQENPAYLGTHPKCDGGLPILVKLIDASQDLSVQVHPDDSYARIHEQGAMGKTELWYVVDAAEGACVTYGFCHDMSARQVQAAIAHDTIENYLQRVPVQKDDVFFVPPGQVHAIGAGVLIAEIQQSSNITYRLYDYNRVDSEGNARPLHIEKALQVANLKSSATPRQPMRLLRFQRGQAIELLCRCAYFQVERMLINTLALDAPAFMRSGANSFQVLLCTQGEGVISWMEEPYPMKRGDCIFVPANSVEIAIEGKAQLLRIGC